MNLSLELFVEVLQTTHHVFGDDILETSTTSTTNFSTVASGFFDDGFSVLDAIGSDPENVSVNNSANNYPVESDDNSDNFASYDYYRPTPTATAIVLAILGLTLLVGIVGNILVMIIIVAVKSMHTTVNKCLFSLALADFIVLTMLPIGSIQVDFTDSTLPLGKEFCDFLNLYDRGGVICSVLTFFYVTIDRYFALCYPLRSRALWTGRKTYPILIGIWIVSLALSYPYVYQGRYQEVYYDNVTHFFCIFDNIENKWMTWYDTAFSVLPIVIPIPVLFALYGRMIYRIKSSVPKTNSGTKGNEVAGRRGRGQVVVMLLTVVVIYMVTQLPFAFLKVFDYHFPTVFSASPYDEKAFTIIWIARILYFVNSTANPVIYFSLSTNFRQGFVQVFCCLERKKSQKHTPETQSSSL